VVFTVALYSSGTEAGSCNYSFLYPNASSTITNLTFCSIMNGQPIDASFVFINPITLQSYPAYIDNVLATIVWPEVTAYIEEVANKNGFIVCQSCLDNLKALLCAGAFPAAGYYSCIIAQIFNIIQQDCNYICRCNSNYCCDIGPETDIECQQAANMNPAYNPGNTNEAEVEACANSLEKADYFTLFQQCNGYLINRAACEEMVGTCACISPDALIAEDACAFYSADGFSLNMPGGDCSSSKGWCAVAKRSTTGSSSGFQINSQLSLNAPSPVAASVYGGSVGGASPNYNANFGNAGIVPQTPAPSPPSGAVSVVSSVALIAFLLALVLL